MGSLGGMSPGGSIALGILVGLISTGIQSLGLTLQRKSHILEDEKGPHDVRPPHRRRRWQLGMGMFIVANILGSSIQISTLPLPVLSTLQASGLVFNSVCATVILGEPFTRWSMYGTCLVCTGAVLIAIFGAIPAPTHTLDELLQLLGRRPFVIWMIMSGLVVAAVSITTELVNVFSNLAQDSRFRLIRGLAYGFISGILSAHSLLVAKSAVELVIKTVVDKNNQFVHWQSWALIVALVILALSQLYYLHRGLKLVSTSVLYPLVFCVYNIFAILDGLIYFHQTSRIKPVQAALIAVGTVILLSGVLALSWRLSDEQHQPAVGQGSLAPGLGLVEDTEGEDEEDNDIMGSDIVISEDESQPLLSRPGYQNFGSLNGEIHGPVGTKKTTWAETREIWGELQDRSSEGSGKGHARQRSVTLPVFREGSNNGLLSTGRQPAMPLTLGAGSSRQEAFGIGSPGKESRRIKKRRKSTGFPGFMARRATSGRKSSGTMGSISGVTGPSEVASSGVVSPFRDAVNGVLKLRFWRKLSSKHGRDERDPEIGLGIQPTETDGLLDLSRRDEIDGSQARTKQREEEGEESMPIPGPSGSSSGTHSHKNSRSASHPGMGPDIDTRGRNR